MISGVIEIQDLVAGTCLGPFLTNLMLKRLDLVYYVSVQSPNCNTYKVADLDDLDTKYVTNGGLVMKFKQPVHQLMFMAHEADLLGLFVGQILDIRNGKEVVAGAMRVPVTMPAKGFVPIDCFDPHKLDTRNLNTLILENCDLSDLSNQISQLPLAYISLSGSQLPTSLERRDIFWNWMSSKTICGTLKTLKLDSISLDVLPFEIMFLRNLHNLSVAHNNLRYLPHFIGELQKLEFLFVADNMLNYLPGSLVDKIFIKIDISDNPFITSSTIIENNEEIWEAMQNINQIDDEDSVQKLTHLSSYAVVKYCIPFQRKIVPRELWDDINKVGWCKFCHTFLQPDNLYVNYTLDYILSLNLIKNNTSDYLQFQLLSCDKCLFEN